MKENEITGLVLLTAVLGALGKWTMFQKAGEKFLTRLVEGHYLRRMGRRVDPEQWQQLASFERQELDTLAILLQRNWNADRVTVVEYDCTDEELPPLATCTVEHREPHMATIKDQIQKLRLDTLTWAQVQQVHSSPSRSLSVPDVRDMEEPALRSQLVRWGVRSAYYQSLPTAASNCGAMLSMSWSTARQLSPEELADLHWLVRNLAATLRAAWAYQKPGE